nr:xylan 1,4-beta-xylosidase [Tanacetum cinerariifolium]
MINCTKCSDPHQVLKAGFIRGKQRYFCKTCEYHFTEARSVSAQPRRRRQSTIGDVARQVGVSPSTVSRALNDRSDISPATRQAILEAALNLDYQPNLMAQGLKSQATSTIGVIIPDIERPFFATAVSGIQQIAMSAGYRVMICQSKESYQAEVSNVQALIASRVDGLLICHSRETENFEHIKYAMRRNIPVVHFDRVCNEVNSAKVILDDRLGAYNVTEHLIDQGCRFGDEFLAHLIEPSLTTVDLHPYHIGQQAASLFLEQMAQKEDFTPRTCIIAGELMIRNHSLIRQYPATETKSGVWCLASRPAAASRPAGPIHNAGKPDFSRILPRPDRDLKNWEQVGNVIDRPSQMNFVGDRMTRGLFAPAIDYHNGTYYVTCTLIDRKGNFVVTAQNPAGPWSAPVWLPEVKGIDPSLFFDETTNKAYVIYNSDPPDNKPLYSGHRSIKQIELNPQTLQTVGEAKIL